MASSRSLACRSLDLGGLQVRLVGVRHGALSGPLGALSALRALHRFRPTVIACECDWSSWREGAVQWQGLRGGDRGRSALRSRGRGGDLDGAARSMMASEVAYLESIAFFYQSRVGVRLAGAFDRCGKTTRRRLLHSLMLRPLQAVRLLTAKHLEPSLFLSRLREQSPASYEVLFSERDSIMSGWIQRAMRDERRGRLYWRCRPGKTARPPQSRIADLLEAMETRQCPAKSPVRAPFPRVSGNSAAHTAFPSRHRSGCPSRAQKNSRPRVALLCGAAHLEGVHRELVAAFQRQGTAGIRLARHGGSWGRRMKKHLSCPLSPIPVYLVLYVLVPLYFVIPWEYALVKYAREHVLHLAGTAESDVSTSG